MAETRPNILWISLEDTSPRFGCYGDPIARTPNLDALAAQGRRYPNAFAVAGVCAPSRSAIITGMYPTSIGAHHMRTPNAGNMPGHPRPYECVPPHYVKLVPEYLRAAGYYCTNNAKTDYQFTPPASSWNQTSDQAHWRNRPDPDQPFFAVFNETKTHESGMWDEKFQGPLETDPDSVEVPGFLPDTPRVRQTIARQYDNLAWADQWVGRILSELEDDGLAQNTAVFIWSDHGEGLPRCKRWPYDSGIHEPLIVRMPGRLDQGDVSEQMVSLIDLGPTVLSLAGVDVPNHMQGRAFIDRSGSSASNEADQSQHAKAGKNAQNAGNAKTHGEWPQTADAGDVQQSVPGQSIGGQFEGNQFEGNNERQTIFATRDRYDTAYDMIRAVRDSRYKYIRHVDPNASPMIWNPYRNRHPAMQEILRLESQGKLSGPARMFFEPRRAEELYDTREDPQEIHNLADQADYRSTLVRLRKVCDDYCARYDKYGAMDEEAMKRQWWAGDEKPTTAAPFIVPINTHQFGITPATHRQRVDVPALVQLHCPTQGGSIVWSSDQGQSPTWQLYTQPIRLTQPGQVTLRTQAHRIGFEPSAINELTLDLTQA